VWLLCVFAPLPDGKQKETSRDNRTIKMGEKKRLCRRWGNFEGDTCSDVNEVQGFEKQREKTEDREGCERRGAGLGCANLRRNLWLCLVHEQWSEEPKGPGPAGRGKIGKRKAKETQG